MNYLTPAILTLLILGLGIFFPQHETAGLEEVVDGDTVNTENDTVRFIGVDTPETSKISENKPSDYGLENNSQTIECLDRYGVEASEFVENQTDETITLVYDRESDSRGNYDRKLAYISSNGDLNRKLLVEGLARVYPSKFSRKNEFYFWQYIARNSGRGVWGC